MVILQQIVFVAWAPNCGEFARVALPPRSLRSLLAAMAAGHSSFEDARENV
jgi:hypothetical protein